MKFTEKEIKIANATSRSKGASAINSDGTIRAIVPNFILKNKKLYQNAKILDFGAGKSPIHTEWLKEQNFDVIAYDFGENHIEGLHDEEALMKRYDVVFASNVLNVQSSIHMLRITLNQIYNALKKHGTFIFNYPKSPRKLDLTEFELINYIEDKFKSKCHNNNGVFTIIKQEDTDKRIICHIRGGLIEEVYSSDPDISFIVVDHDEQDDVEIMDINENLTEECENYYLL